MTGDLFGESAPAPSRRALARAARDEGIQRAADHAERVKAGWRERAYLFFVEFARGRREFLTEEAREYAEDRGLPTPPDKRAWGHVPLRALKNGIVTKGGFAKARDPKVHCSYNVLWVSALFKEPGNE